MGNESSRPEAPVGRSRSLSPLPRDDQFSLDEADDTAPLPSTMPPTISAARYGPAPPGAPGSAAWHRRQRRGRALSPDSVYQQSRSPSPEDRPLNATQPVQTAAHSASPERFAWSATQPEPSTRKKDSASKSKKKKGKKGEAASLHPPDGDATVEEARARLRRAAAPPFDHAEDPLQGLEEDPAVGNEVPQELSPEEARIGRKDKGKGKEVVRDVIPEEATAIADRSIFDFDDEPPPSAQPPRKRDRRNSDSKARRKRKTPPLGEASNGHLHEAAAEHINGHPPSGEDPGKNSQGEVALSATAIARPVVLDGYHSADAVFSRFWKASATGSQHFHVDAEYSEFDDQASESGPVPQEDMPDLDDPPLYDGDDCLLPGDEAIQDGGMPHETLQDETMQDEAMPDNTLQDGEEGFVASDLDGRVARSASPVPPADVDVGNEDDDDRMEEPVAEQHNHDLASTPPESSNKASEPRSRAKRKTKTPYFAREEEENANAFAELPTNDVASPPKARRSQRSRRAQSPAQVEAGSSAVAATTKRKKPKKQPQADTAADDSDAQASPGRSQYASGPLSPTEQNQITRAVERFREDEGLTQEELVQIIHDNPQTSDRPINRQLWASIQDACPSRPRRKLISWCRLRFHNFAARGTWTPQQEDELAELIEKHGKKWSFIAGLINRHQKDVRDRWRNYLLCRGTVKTDVWSEGEEERFRELVEDSIDKIQERLGDNHSKSPEELINWLTISEAMGYTRSRLQCLEKWKRIRAAEPLADQVPTVLPQGNSWRLEKARVDLRRMTVGDKYTLMRAIRDSGVGTEKKIKWKPIVNDTFGGKYERQALVVTWGRLRKAVPDWEWKTTRDCARYLCDMYEREGNFGSQDLDEGEDAEEVPDEGTTVSSDVRRGKGKEVARPASSADGPSPASEPQGTRRASGKASAKTRNSASSRSKRDKFKSKSESRNQDSAAPSPADPTADESADEDVVMEEDENVTKSQAKSSKKRRRQTEKELSLELEVASPQPSPSEEAQAARSKRRERRGSNAENHSPTANGNEMETPQSPSSKGKVSKRSRRESLAQDNDNVESPKAKKRKTYQSSSASKAKTNGVVKASNTSPEQPLTNGARSASVISSDMDDMEDIPARLPDTSQASHY